MDDNLKNELENTYECYICIGQKKEFGKIDLFINAYSMGMTSLLDEAFTKYIALKHIAKDVIKNQEEEEVDIDDIFYKEIDCENGKKMMIFNYIGCDNPLKHLDDAVQQYVKNGKYREFKDINKDNPRVRIIVKE